MTNPPQPSLEPLPLEMRLRSLEGRVGRASDNATPLVTRVTALTTALEDAVAGVPALKQFYDSCEYHSNIIYCFLNLLVAVVEVRGVPP